MLVNYVGADANVHGDRNPQAVSRGANAHVAVRQCFGLDRAPDCFAQAQPVAVPGDDDVVELPGLPPEAELALRNVSRYAFGRLTDQGQLIVMNRARAIHRNVCEQTALHQIDHLARQALLDHVPAHEQNHRSASLAGVDDALGDPGQCRVIHGWNRIAWFEQMVQRHIVGALA